MLSEVFQVENSFITTLRIKMPFKYVKAIISSPHLEFLVVKKTVSQNHSEREAIDAYLAQERKSIEHSRKTVGNRRQQELQNSNIYQNL